MLKTYHGVNSAKKGANSFERNRRCLAEKIPQKNISHYFQAQEKT